MQAGRAMALLHREGLVPRDLLPDNFRVTRGPDAAGGIEVKLCDLGLLRPAADDSAGRLARRPRRPRGHDLVPAHRPNRRHPRPRLAGRRRAGRFPHRAAAAAGETAGRASTRPRRDPRSLGKEEPSVHEGGRRGRRRGGTRARPTSRPRWPRSPPWPRGSTKTHPAQAARSPEARAPPRRPRGGRGEAGARAARGRRQAAPAASGPGRQQTLLIGAAAFGGVLVVGTAVALLAVHEPDDLPKNNPQSRYVPPDGTGNPSPVSSEKSDVPVKPAGPEKAPAPPSPPPVPPPLYVAPGPFEREKVSEEFTSPAAVPQGPPTPPSSSWPACQGAAPGEAGCSTRSRPPARPSPRGNGASSRSATTAR